MYIVFGIIGLIVAYGLWTLKNWARILAIVLCILGILGCVGGIYSMYIIQKLGPAVTIVESIVEYIMGVLIAVFALIIWYLVRVKEAFA